ncbi:MAG: tRNA guanosine(34) transglycosylase Tgt [Vulcanimicrobiaceae bacterium]
MTPTDPEISAAPNGFTLRATDGVARRGSLALAHGIVETPAFMPVGTAATVKALAPNDLREFDARIILANTYHLWLRPGGDTIAELGGLHRFMAWDRNILTDSGGFQVFSLESRRDLSDAGVRFRSHLDGSAHEFTPENVIAFQERLGVDVAMVLDVCVKLPAGADDVAEAVRRTTLWAERSAAARTRTQTQVFAIVQGGLDVVQRERSARQLVDLDFPGYAIGGLSVGESRDDLYRMARFTASCLPSDKPRYLMGVGTVRDLIAAIDGGVDLFDCVYPTRCGRNGRALTRAGDLAIRNAAFARDPGPLDPTCGCAVCATYSRAYLSHLFRADEMLGPRLLSYHNLALLAALMVDARTAIERGTWAPFRDAMLASDGADVSARA